jgi:hypothetical protein
MIDQIMRVGGNIHGCSAFGDDRLHIGPEESHRGAWQPLKDDGCYGPSQRYSDYDLAYGIRNCNWPVGLQMQCCRPGHRAEMVTFDGTNWINRLGVPRTFGVLGKYERRK